MSEPQKRPPENWRLSPRCLEPPRHWGGARPPKLPLHSRRRGRRRSKRRQRRRREEKDEEEGEEEEEEEEGGEAVLWRQTLVADFGDQRERERDTDREDPVEGQASLLEHDQREEVEVERSLGRLCTPLSGST